ncbi:secretin N-terminal domain-containing protein [Humisphaera borealis]|uniref:Type II secretion system protein GspD n=1 Tax=Humisphaera borealis TaxID=2807512 RepID=A0A7M2X2J3_9BACT|nr:secretin N-terminal domain-containing protein [Humisphaera borealis]QOV90980.1 hypothetical protein IPV69_06370 [Humisphaera borealis]
MQVNAAISTRIAGILLSAVVASDVAGQTTLPTTAPTNPPRNAVPGVPVGPAVRMDFPSEPIEIKLLADIITKRLGIPILYDETIAGKRVTVRVPRDVPEAALLGVLQSALRMKGMALVDAEQPGWKQIVNAPSLAAIGRPSPAGAAPEDLEPGIVVSQVFTLERADPTSLAEAVRPLLTQPGGNAQAVPGRRALIISDYPSVVQKCTQLIRALDTGNTAETKFVPLRSADATQVVATVAQLLSGKETQQGGTGVSGISLIADERGNQVLVSAPTGRMAEVLELIAGLDKDPGLETKVYRLKSVSPERLDKLVGRLAGGEGAQKRTYRSSVDRESQSLVITASAQFHAQVAEVVKEIDIPVIASQSPVRFYKLKNAKAADVLSTISGLLADADSNATVEPGDPTKPASDRTARPPTDGMRPAVAGSPTAAAARPLSNETGLPFNTQPAGTSSAGSPFLSGGSAGRRSYGVNEEAFRNSLPAGGSFRGRDASVAADVNTNSIVVIAPPDVQQLYADLISRLDQRRPQVQVEVTIVTLDTTDGATIGVDIARVGGFDGSKVITFSSFGVSGLDPITGMLTPVAAKGGTFALLSPNIADVVIRALATNTRSRLVSAPKLLVNDNGRGRLQSVAQEPFAEILDTSANQSRTGFGGQAQAGTSITIEPHISEGDYLQLTYSVELSSFTGAGADGLPPPSQKNAVDSTVTIPDGHTIVVGGLSVKNLRRTMDSIPFLGDIPGLGILFGTRTKSSTDTTLFVFIRPVILRDDKFEDLKYLSVQNGLAASIPGDFPQSNPVPAR